MENTTTNPAIDPEDSIARYNRLLKYGAVGSTLEAAGNDEDPDLSDAMISHRVNTSSNNLHTIVTEYLNDSPDLHAIADEIMKDGDLALRVLRDKDEKKIKQQPHLLESLEVIVRVDGSRPSFMIKNGEPDEQSSPIGVWKNTLDASREFMREAISWVGRIDMPGTQQGFVGTGFLVHKDLIITNRHVLQLIADKMPNGSWTVRPNVTINFGHEFRVAESSPPRPVKRVLFAGSQIIKSPIDHNKLDLALLELEPENGNVRPDSFFSINMAPELIMPGTPIFTIGYPGNPGPFEVPFTLLEQLFQSTFGHKRLAPGFATASGISLPTSTLAHDATTLGGNSGSPVILIGREKSVCLLHYGGRSADPRENWGHNIPLIIDTKDENGRSLRECLSPFVELLDPFG